MKVGAAAQLSDQTPAVLVELEADRNSVRQKELFSVSPLDQGSIVESQSAAMSHFGRSGPPDISGTGYICLLANLSVVASISH